MVGVPGRSQGCITCRRRRVKCDLRQPHCKRCYKGGKTCEGYEPYRSFVNTFFESFTDHEPSEIDWVKHDGSHQYEFVFENDLIHPPGDPFSSYSGFKQNVRLGLYDTHVLQRLFSKQRPENVRPWIDATMKNAKTTVGRDAILALAQALSAREHGTHSEAAAAQYSRAIGLLHSNLANDDSKNELDNLAAIVLFYYYEMTAASHTDGWSFHAAGMAHLVEARGPENFQTGAAKQLFIICRFKIVYQALLQRKHTFIASPEWKTIPWASDPEPKNNMQRLKDIFSDLPGLLEDGDTVCNDCCGGSSPRSDNMAGLSMETHIQRLIDCFHSLVLWRIEWETEFPHGVAELGVTEESNLRFFAPGELSPNTRTIYWFESARRAREIVFFYGVLIHLFDEMTEWLGPNAADFALASLPAYSPGQTTTCLMPLQSSLTRTDLTTEVFRCVDYLLNGPDPVSGAVQLVFPLRACGNAPIPIWDRVCSLSGFEMIHPDKASSIDKVASLGGVRPEKVATEAAKMFGTDMHDLSKMFGASNGGDLSKMFGSNTNVGSDISMLDPALRGDSLSSAEDVQMQDLLAPFNSIGVDGEDKLQTIMGFGR